MRMNVAKQVQNKRRIKSRSGCKACKARRVRFKLSIQQYCFTNFLEYLSDHAL
jgi:hypothetical protein